MVGIPFMFFNIIRYILKAVFYRVFLGKIPAGNFPQDFTGNGFFSVPVQISFPWSHPNSSRRLLDIPLPSKQFPWKCLISRDFPFPCRKIPSNSRFSQIPCKPKLLKKKTFPRELFSRLQRAREHQTGSARTEYSYLPGTYDMVWFIQHVILYGMIYARCNTPIHAFIWCTYSSSRSGIT